MDTYGEQKSSFVIMRRGPVDSQPDCGLLAHLVQINLTGCRLCLPTEGTDGLIPGFGGCSQVMTGHALLSYMRCRGDEGPSAEMVKPQAAGQGRDTTSLTLPPTFP